MQPRRPDVVIMSALVLAAGPVLAGCLAESPAGTGSSTDTTTSPPSTTQTRTNSSSSTSAAPTTTATPLPKAWESVQISVDAGGLVSVDGQDVGRGSGDGAAELERALGPAEETTPQTMCGDGEPLKNTVYRWGDLSITVLNESPGGEYGFAWPAGEVSGWQVDPTSDGQSGTSPEVAGPGGIEIGDSLSQVQAAHDGKWDSFGVDTVRGNRVYSIFSGDTSGAGFRLGPNDTVVRMDGGYVCSS